MSKRHGWAAAAGLAVMLATGQTASAQDWPARSIKLILPFPPGGPSDLLARSVAEHLSKTLAQAVVVDNRPGGGTVTGAQAALKSDPDGYTLFFGTNTPFALAPVINPNAGYVGTSFTPIITVAESPMVLLASNKSGADSPKALIDAALKTPDAFSYASVGAGSTTHLLGEWFNQVARTKMAHVPYKGSAPAMNDLIGGQVQAFFDVAGTSVEHFNAKTIRVLMVLHDKRWPQLPGVPTSAEAGFPDFVGTFWGAVAGPPGLPKAIVDRVNRDIANLLSDPQFMKRLETIMFQPVGGSPAQLAERIGKETAIWRRVATTAGILK